MLDTYTKARADEEAAFACLDLDVSRIVPPMAFIPIPGEECVSPDGIDMVVDRVTEFDCGIVVAGR